MTLYEELKSYQPFNEQEEKDLAVLLSWCNKENVLCRSSLSAHMTASSWLVNEDFTKVLMVYHNLYHSWSWLGGHADGNPDLLSVACTEAKEESGLHTVKILDPEVFSLEVLTVDGHRKNDTYVSSHLHLNVTYLLQASENEALHIKEDENSQVAWFPLEEAVQASTEPWFQTHIYTKLNNKLSLWLKDKGDH